MNIILMLIVAFVMLYPAAFFGGIIVGKAGARWSPFRKPIFVATYIALVVMALNLFLT